MGIEFSCRFACVKGLSLGLSCLSSQMVVLNFRVSTVPAAKFVCAKPHVGPKAAQEASTGGSSSSHPVPGVLLAFAFLRCS